MSPLERRGRGLKALEDSLDALVCAYTAYFHWYHNGAMTQVFGSVADGYIAVPQPS